MKGNRRTNFIANRKSAQILTAPLEDGTTDTTLTTDYLHCTQDLPVLTNTKTNRVTGSQLSLDKWYTNTNNSNTTDDTYDDTAIPGTFQGPQQTDSDAKNRHIQTGKVAKIFQFCVSC